VLTLEGQPGFPCPPMDMQVGGSDTRLHPRVAYGLNGVKAK